MSDELKELISSADKGDQNAQRELMQRGDVASETGEHQQAAGLYKMVAMAYRIDASRIYSRLSDSEFNQAWQILKTHYYDSWIKNYTTPQTPRIDELREKQLAREASSCILQLRRKDGFSSMIRYLEKRLEEHDVHFCRPGGTINRHFYYMINQPEDFIEFMHDIDIRVVLDPICDEVLKMCSEPQTETYDNQ